MVFLIITGIIAFILFISIVKKYNKMIKYRNKVKESLALIDIHLKLRFDLIPNLVKTVKGYAKHENEIFTKIIETRKMAVKATDEKEKLEYSGMRRMIQELMNAMQEAKNYMLDGEKFFISIRNAMGVNGT